MNTSEATLLDIYAKKRRKLLFDIFTIIVAAPILLALFAATYVAMFKTPIATMTGVAILLLFLGFATAIFMSFVLKSVLKETIRNYRDIPNQIEQHRYLANLSAFDLQQSIDSMECFYAKQKEEIAQIRQEIKQLRTTHQQQVQQLNTEHEQQIQQLERQINAISQQIIQGYSPSEIDLRKQLLAAKTRYER